MSSSYNDDDIIKRHECRNLPYDEDPKRYEIVLNKPWSLIPYEHWSITDHEEYSSLSKIKFCPFCGEKLLITK